MTNMDYKQLKDGFRHQVRMFSSLGRAEMLEVVLDFFDDRLLDLTLPARHDLPPKSSWQK